MMLKLILSAVIVIASAMIGNIYSMKYAIRVAQLRRLQTALQMLETEVIYRYSPLPEAFKSVALSMKGEIQCMMEDTASMLSDRKGYTIDHVWETALRRYAKSMALTGDDIGILLNLGKTLGSSDADNQIKYFELILNQLRQQEKSAEAEKAKNQKLYNNLGILGGLGIAILIL